MQMSCDSAGRNVFKLRDHAKQKQVVISSLLVPSLVTRTA